MASDPALNGGRVALRGDPHLTCNDSIGLGMSYRLAYEDASGLSDLADRCQRAARTARTVVGQMSETPARASLDEMAGHLDRAAELAQAVSELAETGQA